MSATYSRLPTGCKPERLQRRLVLSMSEFVVPRVAGWVVFQLRVARRGLGGVARLTRGVEQMLCAPPGRATSSSAGVAAKAPRVAAPPSAPLWPRASRVWCEALRHATCSSPGRRPPSRCGMLTSARRGGCPACCRARGRGRRSRPFVGCRFTSQHVRRQHAHA